MFLAEKLWQFSRGGRKPLFIRIEKRRSCGEESAIDGGRYEKNEQRESLKGNFKNLVWIGLKFILASHTNLRFSYNVSCRYRQILLQIKPFQTPILNNSTNHQLLCFCFTEQSLSSGRSSQRGEKRRSKYPSIHVIDNFPASDVIFSKKHWFLIEIYLHLPSFRHSFAPNKLPEEYIYL